LEPEPLPDEADDDEPLDDEDEADEDDELPDFTVSLFLLSDDPESAVELSFLESAEEPVPFSGLSFAPDRESLR
jgi:hypothetical protein